MAHRITITLMQGFIHNDTVFKESILMRAVVPFKRERAKSRLSPVLSVEERSGFAHAMLRDVLCALSGSGMRIDVLTTSVSGAMHVQAENVIVSELGLNDALNQYLDGMVAHSEIEPVIIIMADLPLVTEDHITEICNLDSDVVIVPGKRGGTNVLFLKDPSGFRVDYYGTSFLDHMQIARDAGMSIEVFDSFMLSTDIDEPGDLIEVLIHGNGEAAGYLRNLGFEVCADNDRVELRRRGNG